MSHNTLDLNLAQLLTLYITLGKSLSLPDPFSSSDSFGEWSLTHGIPRRIQWDDVWCVNLLKQHVVHMRSSSNVNSSALQVVQVSRCLSGCFSCLPLKFQTQSRQILLFFWSPATWAVSPVSLPSGLSFITCKVGGGVLVIQWTRQVVPSLPHRYTSLWMFKSAT